MREHFSISSCCTTKSIASASEPVDKSDRRVVPSARIKTDLPNAQEAAVPLFTSDNQASRKSSLAAGDVHLSQTWPTLTRITKPSEFSCQAVVMQVKRL